MKERIEKAVDNAAANVSCETESLPRETLEEIKRSLLEGDRDSIIYRLYELALKELEEENHGLQK